MLRVLERTCLSMRGRSLFFTTSRCLKQSVEEKLGLPSKPKKPVSTFVKFMMNERQGIVQKNPKASPKEIMSIGSQLWKKCSEATKNSLKEQYQKEFEKYSLQLAKYNQRLTPQQKEEIKEAVEELKDQKVKREAKIAESKRIKELGKPIKPLSSYLLYARDEQSNRGNTPVHEFQSQLSKKWQNLPAEIKNKYAAEAAKYKEAYEKALETWEKKMIKEGNIDVVRQKTLNDDSGKNHQGGK